MRGNTSENGPCYYCDTPTNAPRMTPPAYNPLMTPPVYNRNGDEYPEPRMCFDCIETHIPPLD